MSLVGEQILLRVYLRGGDRSPHVPTSTLLIQTARKHNLAGTTVLRGILGFGHQGTANKSPWSIIDRSPTIVEIVDSSAKITAFIIGPLRAVLAGDPTQSRDILFTIERAAVIMYRPRTHHAPETLLLPPTLKPLSTVPMIDREDKMTTRQNGILLRVFMGDSDKFQNQLLYEAIIAKARQLGLSGATVLRGTEGFGAHSVVHKSSLLEFSTDLPVVVEIVDAEDKIQSLLPHLEVMVREGMITMEQVSICRYQA